MCPEKARVCGHWVLLPTAFSFYNGGLLDRENRKPLFSVDTGGALGFFRTSGTCRKAEVLFGSLYQASGKRNAF